MKKTYKALLSSSFIALAALGLAACGTGDSGKEDGWIQTEAKYPTGRDRDGQAGGDIYAKNPSIFGEGGLSIGGKRGDDNEDGASGIAVNSFLWRASLDTVSFMPLASADPFGGVILTDWYTPEGNEAERFKINVFILSRSLRSDGIEVRVFKQVRNGNSWRDVKASGETARQIEDTILTRARQLRIAQIGE